VDEFKNSNQSSFDKDKTLFQDLNNSIENAEINLEEENKNFDLKITPSEIVNQMSQNDFLNIAWIRASPRAAIFLTS
jgi:hypothetical protein